MPNEQNERVSTPLSKEKVLEQINLLPAALRKKFMSLYRKKINERYGSPAYSRKHLNGLTDQDRLEMARLHCKYHVSFRALESIWHLVPNSGNDAKRQVDHALRMQQQRAEQIRQSGRKKKNSKKELSVA